MRRWVGTIVMTCAVLAPSAAAAQLPGTGDSIPAPATQLSADGRSATDGVRTLTVSQASGIDPAGQTLTVTGAGYDSFKGVYVAFCLIPPTNQLPTPCGGGMDQSGASGASQWISSNPPPTGVGLAQPYGGGGSFTVSIAVTPTIQNVDCRRVRCAIVTRNDHTRTSDRSQDIFVPVVFATAPVAPPPTVAPLTVVPVAPVAPTPTTAAPAPTTVAPVPTTEAPATAAPSTTRAPVTTVPDAPTAREVAGVPVSSSSDGGGVPVVVILVGILLIGAAAAGTFFVVRARRSAV